MRSPAPSPPSAAWRSASGDRRDQRIRLRIGINLGDVVSEEGDLFGDGVNVAARLEQLAQPGGIVISGTAYDHLQGKLGCGFQDLGEQRVKNIARPVRAYQVVSEPGEMSSAAPGSSWSHRSRITTTALGRQWPVLAAVVALVVIGAGIIGWLRPWQGSDEMAGTTLDTRRVAVLPFANISADAADEYFSDGLTEELISQLSKIGKLRVIARTSIMKYKGTNQDIAEIGRALQVGTILEGSVRKAGNQVRITAQLIDVASQAHLWSEDYDRALRTSSRSRATSPSRSPKRCRSLCWRTSRGRSSSKTQPIWKPTTHI